MTSTQSEFIRIISNQFKTDVVCEYRFHKTRKWRIDYYLPEYMIAIEVEGAVWTRGRHTRGSGFVKDIEKYNEITAAGIALIRTTPSKLLNQDFIDLIERCIIVRKNGI